MEHACPKCNSKMTLGRGVNPAHGQLFLYKEPVKLFGKFSQIKAWVCPGCGFVEWYVDQPEKFLE